jgi:quinol monooxygenase YgiN
LSEGRVLLGKGEACMNSIRLVVAINVRPGRGDEYAEAWAGYYDNVKHEDGCIQFELFRSTGNPDHFFVLELWQDRAAFDAHWRIAQNRSPVRSDLLDNASAPTEPGGGVEIYWNQQEHHYDSVAAQWRPNES